MLHRVVMKRSGRRAVAEDASGFTAADHLICTIVRQARNFPPAAGILRVAADRSCAGGDADHRSQGAGLTSEIVTKTRLWKLAQGFRDRIPCAIKFLTLRHLVSHRSVQGRLFPHCIP